MTRDYFVNYGVISRLLQVKPNTEWQDKGKNIKKQGPETDPWGTPEGTGAHAEFEPFT